MTPDYQFYHGAFLHEIINASRGPLLIRSANLAGRRDAFVIAEKVGLLLKHSSARITPWGFSFTKDSLVELHSLRQCTSICFIGLICGDDGFLCIRDSDFVGILRPSETEVLSLRAERRPRKMYRITSSGNELDRKLSKGVQDIIDAVEGSTSGMSSLDRARVEEAPSAN